MLATEGGAIKGLAAPGGGQLSRKELDQLVQDAKGRGAAGLVWLVVEADGDPVARREAPLGGGDRRRRSAPPARPRRPRSASWPTGSTACNVALDGVRRHLAERLDLIPASEWRYAWYTDPPLFDWSDEEGKWVSNHHPFTAPASDDLDPKTAKAKAYDLVLNGFEVGGGSIRIHRPEVQQKVFEVLGLSDAEIEEKFGHLIRAFRYGAPPHGGIAMGMDRIVMLMAGKDAIRDVTAFPKAQSGADPLTGAPAPVDDEPAPRAGREGDRAARLGGEGAMTTPTLLDDDLAMLRGENFAHVAVIRPDGSPHVTVTWIDGTWNDHVLVNTAAGRVKDRYLRGDPRVSVTVHDEADPYRWHPDRRRRGRSSSPARRPRSTSTS